MDWSLFNTSDVLLGIVGGSGIGYIILKKFATMVTKQEGETSAYEALQGTVKVLQDENARLHKTVIELQQEVAKLHVVIAELTHKLSVLSISSENQKVIDELAREGKIDRRQGREKQ